jgi:hypothetical protein
MQQAVFDKAGQIEVAAAEIHDPGRAGPVDPPGRHHPDIPDIGLPPVQPVQGVRVVVSTFVKQQEAIGGRPVAQAQVGPEGVDHGLAS